MSQLVFGHSLVSNGDGHAGDFLQLEFDASSGIINLLFQRFGVSDDLGEHSNSVKDGPEDGRDLLNEGISSEKDVIFLGPLFNGFLLFVEFLQSFKINGINIESFCLLDVFGISNKTDLELGSWDVWKSDSSSESFIFLGVVIFKTNLEFNSFLEFSLFLVLNDGVNALCDLSLS